MQLVDEQNRERPGEAARNTRESGMNALDEFDINA
jgi:hypothetical protein